MKEQSDESHICDECQPIVEAFLNYSQDLDDQVRMLAELCSAIGSGGQLSHECVGEMGYTLDEYIDKQDIARSTFFGTKLPSRIDRALLLAEQARINVRTDGRFLVAERDAE